MDKRLKITIEVDSEIDCAISDILCWLRGYLSGREDELDNDFVLLSPAIEELKELNYAIKRELKNKIKIIIEE